VMRAAAVAREVAKNDSNHVPTSVDAYTDAALKGWFEDKDIATGLQLSLNKNRLTSLGSNFTDFKKLGFKDEDALTKAHKSIDLSISDSSTEWWRGFYMTRFLSLRARQIRQRKVNSTEF
jgi:hypothetical protein